MIPSRKIITDEPKGNRFNIEDNKSTLGNKEFFEDIRL